MKTFIFLLTFLWAGTGYSYYSHGSWSAKRGSPYYLPYLFITQSEGIHSKLTLTNDETEETEVTNFKGMGLKTALGTEISRFARFSAYHLYRDTSESKAVSLRGTEIGGEIKLSFYGPVVNLEFGLGLHGSKLIYQNPTDSRSFIGNGYTGSVGFERFIDSRASVMFTLKGQKETLRPEETKRKESAELNSYGGALAFILWLN